MRMLYPITPYASLISLIAHVNVLQSYNMFLNNVVYYGRTITISTNS